MKILHNPRCRKSRETLQIIEKKGKEIEIIEYLKVPLTKKELTDIIDLLGITPIQLIRKSEPIFKDKYKGIELTDSQWIEAMVANPILIERPIVIEGKKAVLGRPPENVNSLF